MDIYILTLKPGQDRLKDASPIPPSTEAPQTADPSSAPWNASPNRNGAYLLDSEINSRVYMYIMI